MTTHIEIDGNVVQLYNQYMNMHLEMQAFLTMQMRK